MRKNRIDKPTEEKLCTRGRELKKPEIHSRQLKEKLTVPQFKIKAQIGHQSHPRAKRQSKKTSQSREHKPATRADQSLPLKPEKLTPPKSQRQRAKKESKNPKPQAKKGSKRKRSRKRGRERGKRKEERGKRKKKTRNPTPQKFHMKPVTQTKKQPTHPKPTTPQNQTKNHYPERT
jgi:hypothetical protein